MEKIRKNNAVYLIIIILILFLAGGTLLFNRRPSDKDKNSISSRKVHVESTIIPSKAKDVNRFSDDRLTPRIDALLLQAESFLKDSEYRKAIKIMNKALEENPEMGKRRKMEIYRELAMAYREAKDYDAAAKYYKILVEKDPDSSEFNQRYGREVYRMGKYDKAEAYSKKALALNPDDYRAVYTLADIAWHRGEYEKAMEIYKKGLNFKESRHVGVNGIMECLVGMKKMKEAAEYAATLPDTADIHTHLAMIYFDAGYYREASEEYRKALAFEPDSIVDICECYLAMEKQNRGREFLREYSKKYPTHAALANYGVGHYYQIVGSFAKAEKYFNESVRMDRKNILPLLGLIRLYLAAGRLDKAGKAVEDAKKAAPENLRVKAASAWFYAAIGKREKAKPLIDEAVEKASGDYYVLMETARACHWLKDYTRAIELYSDALEKVPYLEEDHIIATEEMGRILLEMGDFERADKKFRTAYYLARGSHSAAGMGDLYFARGKYREAEKYYREALTYPPPDIGAYFKLAKTYMRMNNRKEAVNTLGSLLKIDHYYGLLAGKDKDLTSLMQEVDDYDR